MTLAVCTSWVWLNPNLALDLTHDTCVTRGSGGPLGSWTLVHAHGDTRPHSLNEAFASYAPRPRSNPNLCWFFSAQQWLAVLILFCTTMTCCVDSSLHNNDSQSVSQAIFLGYRVGDAHSVSLGRYPGLAWVDDWVSLGWLLRVIHPMMNALVRWVVSAAAVQHRHKCMHVLSGRCWGAWRTPGFIPVHSAIKIVYII